MSAWTHYLNASRVGKVNWYHWLGGFWLIFVGLNIAQFSALILTMIVMAVSEPDTFSTFMETIQKQSEAGSGGYDNLLLLILLATTLFWVLSRVLNDKKIIKIAAYLGLLGTIISVIVFYLQVKSSDASEINNLLLSSMGLNPVLYITFLISFPIVFAFTFLIQKHWHGRSITSLHTAFERYNWNRTFFAIGVFWAIAAIFGAIGHLSGLSPLKMTFDPSRFFGFAIASLLFIPLQSATEEIIVRGYMNQGLGQYIKSPWIVFIITSLFFMALHLANPESTSSAEKGALMHVLTMSSYFSFGFLLCVLVYFEGGLETAIGVHVANNLFAAIFVNYEGSVLPTPSMFIASLNPNYDLPIGMMMLALVTFILVKTRPSVAKTFNTSNIN